MNRRTIIRSLAQHDGRFVSVAALAEYVGCDPRTIRRMIAHGALEGRRVGREWRVPIEAARKAFG